MRYTVAAQNKIKLPQENWGEHLEIVGANLDIPRKFTRRSLFVG